MSLTLGHVVELRRSLLLGFLFVLRSSELAVQLLVGGVLWGLLAAEMTSRSLSASLFIRSLATLPVAVLLL